MIKRLVHSGPASFFDALRAAGLDHKILPGYTNICHLCTAMFADPEIIAAIRNSIDIEEQQLVSEILRPCLAA